MTGQPQEFPAIYQDPGSSVHKITKTAVLLAAGIGSRLGKLTQRHPKCLLKLSPSGPRLIDITLENLSSLGIEELIIITGYQADSLNEYLSACALPYRMRSVFNRMYAKYNNFYSLYRALSYVENDFLLINSDVLAHGGVLQSLDAATSSALAVDVVSPVDEESMKVHCYGQVIEDISKGIPISEAHGEYIGISKIQKKDIRVLQGACRDLLEAGQTDAYYEDAIRLCIRRGEVECTLVPASVPWIEVDTVSDLERAKVLWRTMEA